MSLADRTLVLGLGRSGVATARYLADLIACGEVGSVVVADERTSPALEETAEALRLLGVEVNLGVDQVEGVFDLCVASPGIAPSRPLMRSATDASARIISELEFAFQRSRSPWIAITGTNGKTTTTRLVGHLLTEAGIANEVVGNIGEPAIAVVDSATPATAIVAEVSSFQLALAATFRPRVSVLLNITPDHADWHGSFEAYASDKARVFMNQGPGTHAVIDIDDAGARAYVPSVRERGVTVSEVSITRVPVGGAGLQGEKLSVSTPHGITEVVDRKELLIRGDHNISNALAAACAAYRFGAPVADIAMGLASFRPIEHRLEPVAEIGDVEYVNDSKATNPDAVLKALTAFGDQPVVLLLGGRNKGSDFTELARAAAARAREVILFGEAAAELEAAMRPAGASAQAVPHLADAVRMAQKVARPGDVVLLSPACASFDEFSGYEQRGRAFKDLVLERSSEGVAS
jgi:UDP-N-acetylmuramoylalanine--D-glutamate ligase